jgi:hypothetical protein
MLTVAFVLATIVYCLQGVDLPVIPLHAYVPWIAIAILRHPSFKDFFKLLIKITALGVMLDLFSDDPLGLYPISYALTATFLFRFRNRFLYSRPLHLALLSTLVALTSSLLQLFFLFLFDTRTPLSGKWILIDWLLTGLIDGAYAFIWFFGPLYLFEKARRNWMVFWLKKKHSHA